MGSKKNNTMPWSHDPSVQALRLTYNAAIAAHAACARVLTEASIRGETPSHAAMEAEVAARARLDDARSKLHAAMALFVGAAAAEAAIDPANE